MRPNKDLERLMPPDLEALLVTGRQHGLYPFAVSHDLNWLGCRFYERHARPISRMGRRNGGPYSTVRNGTGKSPDFGNRLPHLTKTSSNEQFAAVVMPHLDDAYAVARWLTGNGADAEDVVQEACVRALLGLDGYKGGNARAWLLAITRNAAFTWLARNRPKALAVTEDIETLAPADGAPSPEDVLIAKTDAAALETAIGALPQHFKETLILRDVTGLSYREISEITGMPLGTVMSRLARARTLLISALGSQKTK
jgi:RNA polymerase sigma factor (sigma-70 family)